MSSWSAVSKSSGRRLRNGKRAQMPRLSKRLRSRCQPSRLHRVRQGARREGATEPTVALRLGLWERTARTEILEQSTSAPRILSADVADAIEALAVRPSSVRQERHRAEARRDRAYRRGRYRSPLRPHRGIGFLAPWSRVTTPPTNNRSFTFLLS